MGGATNEDDTITINVVNFNPRSPWGERQRLAQVNKPGNKFQSTLPVGGATLSNQSVVILPLNFNPRSPWGERRQLRFAEQ